MFLTYEQPPPKKKKNKHPQSRSSAFPQAEFELSTTYFNKPQHGVDDVPDPVAHILHHSLRIFLVGRDFDIGPKPNTLTLEVCTTHTQTHTPTHAFYLQLTGAPAGGEQPRLQGMRLYLWANCTAEQLGDLLCIIEMDCSIDY